MVKPEDALKQINRSGYPFQLRVEQQVVATRSDHGWSVASREHPWAVPDAGSSGFIDIVLQHDHFVTYRLVLECKRIKADDGRQLNWHFLVPDKILKPTALASCFEVEGNGKRDDKESKWEDLRVWDNVRVTPESLQAEFCVMPSDEQRRSPILESLAAEVLQSVEGLAHEEVSVARSTGGNQHTRLFILPAVVMNAALTVCRFNPSLIKIEDGTLDATDAELETVPFIRFRKSLATGFPNRQMNDLKAANRARERTVFIVTAAHIADFLKGWRVEALNAYEGFATEKLW